MKGIIHTWYIIDTIFHFVLNKKLHLKSQYFKIQSSTLSALVLPLFSFVFLPAGSYNHPYEVEILTICPRDEGVKAVS